MVGVGCGGRYVDSQHVVSGWHPVQAPSDSLQCFRVPSASADPFAGLGDGISAPRQPWQCSSLIPALCDRARFAKVGTCKPTAYRLLIYSPQVAPRTSSELFLQISYCSRRSLESVTLLVSNGFSMVGSSSRCASCCHQGHP